MWPNERKFFLYVFQKGRGGPSSSGLQTGGLSHVTSSSGMQVTGKDRALFFRRPGMSFHRFFFHIHFAILLTTWQQKIVPFKMLNK